LFRYVGSNWVELPTTLIDGEGAVDITYEAVTPGFSVFVIVIPPPVVVVSGGTSSGGRGAPGFEPNLISLVTLISSMIILSGYDVFRRRKKL
tara:strand:- start:94 stop:369 length:276 start_codon:yes stop_codon:yes gene_type:complete